MKTLIIALCFFTLSTFAEDIHLKNGRVYKNVFITKKTDYAILFKYNGSVAAVQLYDVLRIDDVIYNPNFTSSLTVDGVIITDPTILTKKEMKTIQPNINFLLVSFLSGLYALDNFTQSSTLQESIDNFKKLKLNAGGLEKEKFRRTVYGIIASTICAISFYICIERVEVKASPNSLSLSYNF